MVILKSKEERECKKFEDSCSTGCYFATCYIILNPLWIGFINKKGWAFIGIIVLINPLVWQEYNGKVNKCQIQGLFEVQHKDCLVLIISTL